MTTGTNLQLKEELKQESNNAVSQAKILVITDNRTNESATIFLKNVKALQLEIKKELRPAIEQAHELHRTLVAQEKKFLEPLQEAETLVKRKMGDFLFEQEKIRIEEQRKAQQAAEAAERKRRAELEEQAKRHEAAGRMDKAEERRAMAEEVFVQAPIVESKVEKQAGVATVQNWKFEVIDEMKIPREYLVVDESAIGKIVRAFKNKEKTEKTIPGIRVWAETNVAVRV